MEQLQHLLDQARTEFAAVTDLTALDQIKARFLGKQGPLQDVMKGMAALPPEERPLLGQKVNAIKSALEQLLQEHKQRIKAEQLARQLAHEALDVSLPGRGEMPGGRHPVMLTQARIQQLFASMGFEVADGPEVETDFYNFTALNIPETHPARAMHDTFYVENGAVLRTHTSPIQIRYMQGRSAPIKIIAPGRVYRVDSDATHSPMFHQMEGLWVDAEVSFADLKSVLIDFLRQFFEREDLQVRFRPSFFPFTEPSAEIDVLGRKGWLEVGGCGMVHPNVLRHVGIDPEANTGFAFGIGLDRFAMLRYGVDDLRLFFENDLVFLQQFQG